MTDYAALAEAIERDRENGTPGPWKSDSEYEGPEWGESWRVTANNAGKMCDVAEFVLTGPDAHRIARLPDLETAFLELWARVQWQPIETAPKYGVPHIRGLWVHSAETKERLYWQADTGFINEEGNFVGWSDCDFGWNAEDYTHWMPLTQSPETGQ